MPSSYQVRKQEYYDSVFLMGINKTLSDIEGVEQTVVLMASIANKALLAELGFAGPDIDAAQANDLVVGVIASEDAVIKKVLDKLDQVLQSAAISMPATNIRTLEAALERRTNANLAVFSIPGEYVAAEAHKALHAGLHTFIFSSNVSVEDELALKQLGEQKGLLVMGPDCGTSLIGGAGIGFANAVRQGPIGAVGPSGTGLQEFTSMVHNLGGGISHAIGTGSNDLKDSIGGITTLMALRALENDHQTKVIAVIAKPPEARTLARIADAVKGFKKPLIGCFLGAIPSERERFAPFAWARTIDAAVQMALEAAGIEREAGGESISEIHSPGWSDQQKYLRGIFAGGTFCFQAQQVLADSGIFVHSNGPLDKAYLIADPDQSIENTLVDMGDEYYTLAKPHPMIDGTERGRRIMVEAQDPKLAILLLDFILGYNAAADPVGELLPSIRSARKSAEQRGGELIVVASITGTDGDVQEKGLQRRILEEEGVVVFESNAAAAGYCRDLLMRLEVDSG